MTVVFQIHNKLEKSYQAFIPKIATVSLLLVLYSYENSLKINITNYLFAQIMLTAATVHKPIDLVCITRLYITFHS